MCPENVLFSRRNAESFVAGRFVWKSVLFAVRERAGRSGFMTRRYLHPAKLTSGLRGPHYRGAVLKFTPKFQRTRGSPAYHNCISASIQRK